MRNHNGRHTVTTHFYASTIEEAKQGVPGELGEAEGVAARLIRLPVLRGRYIITPAYVGRLRAAYAAPAAGFRRDPRLPKGAGVFY